MVINRIYIIIWKLTWDLSHSLSKTSVEQWHLSPSLSEIQINLLFIVPRTLRLFATDDRSHKIIVTARDYKSFYGHAGPIFHNQES